MALGQALSPNLCDTDPSIMAAVSSKQQKKLQKELVNKIGAIISMIDKYLNN
jgi:hypothetical protein